MNKTEIWQKIELLLEKPKHHDCVALCRADFEETMKDASNFAYIEIKNVAFPDLLEKLRKELASTLSTKSVRNSVLRVGVPSADALSATNMRNLLETIQEFTSSANLIWGTDVDSAISSGCYSVVVVFAMLTQ